MYNNKNSDDEHYKLLNRYFFFQPDYTLTINDMTDMGIKKDVPIILNDISYEDSYQGDFQGPRRVIIYTMSFTSKFFLYGSQLHLVKLLKLYKWINMTNLPDVTPTRESKGIQLHLVQFLSYNR